LRRDAPLIEVVESGMAMSDSPFGSPPPGATPATRPFPPWGFVGTVLWTLLAFVAWFAAQTLVAIGILVWQNTVEPGSADPQKLMTDALALGLVTIVASPTWIGIAALAARLRRWRFADYMALVVPKQRELVFAIGCLVVTLVAFDLITWMLGRDIIPRFMIDAYQSAHSPLAVALLFVAIVIVAPICEEIAFRGFLFRGLSASFVGVAGAIVLTSAGWALMHVQYDWFVIFQIFLLGILFGWLRWATGSTLLTIILHVIANFSAFTQTVIKVHWFS
jgi:membrane protease YdiL (CAAX protease family)